MTRLAAIVVLVLMASACVTRAEPARVVRICADPNNLPFSNSRLEGFENRLADLVAREMHAKASYTWWAQRRGFFRSTLNASLCDVVIGVPARFEMAATTVPYYRSTYVFVTRHQDGPVVRSLDDAVLRRVRIGVQLAGDDRSNTPPAHALAARDIVQNVRGYTLFGDYSKPNPPSAIIDAVAAREVDVAIVWGPLAGFFVPRSAVRLDLARIVPERDGPLLPFAFDIAMGVRRGDRQFLGELNAIIARRRGDIDRILRDYNVPRLDTGADR